MASASTTAKVEEHENPRTRTVIFFDCDDTLLSSTHLHTAGQQAQELRQDSVGGLMTTPALPSREQLIALYGLADHLDKEITATFVGAGIEGEKKKVKVESLLGELLETGVFKADGETLRVARLNTMDGPCQHLYWEGKLFPEGSAGRDDLKANPALADITYTMYVSLHPEDAKYMGWSYAQTVTIPEHHNWDPSEFDTCEYDRNKKVWLWRSDCAHLGQLSICGFNMKDAGEDSFETRAYVIDWLRRTVKRQLSKEKEKEKEKKESDDDDEPARDTVDNLFFGMTTGVTLLTEEAAAAVAQDQVMIYIDSRGNEHKFTCASPQSDVAQSLLGILEMNNRVFVRNADGSLKRFSCP